MLGTTMGVGITGPVVAAIRHTDDEHLALIVVHAADTQAGERYVCGRIRLDDAGRPQGEEWSSGYYFATLGAAVANMVDRAGVAPT